jgi:hypothetical protein
MIRWTVWKYILCLPINKPKGFRILNNPLPNNVPKNPIIRERKVGIGII